jgi:Phytanoyl-CoA dioxygenase (PhyH)
MQPVYRDSHPTATHMATPLAEIRKTLPLRVLSDDDWRHWTTRGFVVIRQAVPRENVERLVKLLWEFDEKAPDDPSTWFAPQRREHKMRELNNTGMLEIYNHQYLWDNRMEPRVYNAFVDIWDREDLWVAIDRAMLNPPRKVKDGRPGFIHWDVDTSLRPLPIGVQGVLSLSKQDPEVGGFQCVPELFNAFDAWVKTQPADRDPMHPDVTGLEVVYVPLEPGDLLIFNSLLAHGVRPNYSENRVRMAQYISMYPADWENTAEREERVRQWREKDHPHRDAFPGDPRDWEKHHTETARLTPLGEKLLGLTNW